MSAVQPYRHIPRHGGGGRVAKGVVGALLKPKAPFARQLEDSNMAVLSTTSAKEAGTRMQSILPQNKVVLTAGIRLDEAEKRAKDAEGSNQVYSEAGLVSSHDLLPKHGMMGVFFLREGMRSTRGGVGGHLSMLEFTTNTNGMPTKYEIIGVGFMQSDEHIGNQQATVAINGTDTTVNYHTGNVYAFDKLYVDPFPEITESGRARVYGPEGVNAGVHNMVMRPMNPGDFHSSIVEMERTLWEHALTRAQGKMTDILDLINGQAAFLRAVDSICGSFFRDVQRVGVSDPIRTYARIWLTKTLYDNFSLLAMDGKVELSKVVHALRALVVVQKAVYLYNKNASSQFDAHLPKYAFSGRIGDKEDCPRAVLEREVPVTFNNENVEPTAAVMMKVDKICGSLYTSQLQALTQRIADYRQRFFGGTALTSAPSGVKYDFFIRR